MTIPIIRTQHGAFCPACQSLLSIEEEDFEMCEACGGYGIGTDNDDIPGDDTIWQAGGIK